MSAAGCRYTRIFTIYNKVLLINFCKDMFGKLVLICVTIATMRVLSQNRNVLVQPALGCTLYIVHVPWLRESVIGCGKEQKVSDCFIKWRRPIMGHPCRVILEIYAEYSSFFPLIVCLYSHSSLLGNKV